MLCLVDSNTMGDLCTKQLASGLSTLSVYVSVPSAGFYHYTCFWLPKILVMLYSFCSLWPHWLMRCVPFNHHFGQDLEEFDYKHMCGSLTSLQKSPLCYSECLFSKYPFSSYSLPGFFPTTLYFQVYNFRD